MDRQQKPRVKELSEAQKEELRIMIAEKRQECREFFKSIGCAIARSPAEHLVRLIPDSIIVECDISGNRLLAKVNDCDLTRRVALVEFRYKTKREFQHIMLAFRPEPILVDKLDDLSAVKGDDALHFAGIMVEAQTEDVNVTIKVPDMGAGFDASIVYKSNDDEGFCQLTLNSKPVNPKYLISVGMRVDIPTGRASIGNLAIRVA